MNQTGAYGKVILFGEHAAVYSRRALAVGIPEAVRLLAAEPDPHSRRLRIRVDPGPIEADESQDSLLGQGLRRLLEIVPGKPLGCRVRIQARIPIGAGLGGSASLSVALVRALARIRQVQLSRSDVHHLAHELERIFHNTPSGLDDTLAVYGGLCLFRRGGLTTADLSGPGRPGRRIDDNTIGLDLPVPAMLIGLSGVPRQTRVMVENVRHQWEADRQRVESIFNAIDDCLDRGLSALVQGDIEALGVAMTANQQHLARLDLTCPEIDTLIDSALAAGATGAKLTGAGGGGCVVAVCRTGEERVLEAWRSRGFEALRLNFTPAQEEMA